MPREIHSVHDGFAVTHGAADARETEKSVRAIRRIHLVWPRQGEIASAHLLFILGRSGCEDDPMAYLGPGTLYVMRAAPIAEGGLEADAGEFAVLPNIAVLAGWESHRTGRTAGIQVVAAPNRVNRLRVVDAGVAGIGPG